ncbi:unnamed protein product [Adineta ricciae]|uniref:Uncharacterized protein n=1 Tax=Adineta ricciae TaxID=249248 RepID=A0A814KY67_ADIRI|nr:unnamed protein product [Adineta ricciae]CAF1567692.1 unnamed protein product [Adineta ricciae]
MAIKENIFPLAIMTLILIFSIIHLGVSIGIIGQYRKYSSFFGPQIGLAGYNLAISVFGLAAGINGLRYTNVSLFRVPKVVYVSDESSLSDHAAVGIMALASLVTAIIVNAKSISYVGNRFEARMSDYGADSDARNVIDKFQTNYQCCGAYTWLDWANVDLVAPNATTTTAITTSTSTTTTTTATSTSTSTTTTSGSGKSAALNQEASPANIRRRKRQAVSSYGDITGLPILFGVVFPYSCCTSDALTVTDGTITYCVSNQNGAVNHFYTNGCIKDLDTIAGNQSMGFGIINCFLIVLSFVAIPLLWKMSASV